MAEGNFVVLNQGLNPLVNYNYMLRVEGVFDLPCKSVHSFTKENEYEYIQEGGLNDYVHMLRKPVSKPFTFTVERYVGIDYYDPLQNGVELVLPVILMVTRYAKRFDITKRCYVFTGCTVISKEYGELNAEQSGLLTERTVIGYREMLVVNSVDITRKPFDIKDLEASRRYAKHNENDSTHAEAVQWKFKQTDEGGKVTGNTTKLRARTLEMMEEEKAEKAKKANKVQWKFKQTDGEGKVTGNTKTLRARTLEPTEAEQVLWKFKQEAAEEKVTGNTKILRAKTGPSTEAVSRDWKKTPSHRTLLELGIKPVPPTKPEKTYRTPEGMGIKPAPPTKPEKTYRTPEDAGITGSGIAQRKWPSLASARQPDNAGTVQEAGNRLWKFGDNEPINVKMAPASSGIHRKWPPERSAKQQTGGDGGVS